MLLPHIGINFIFKGQDRVASDKHGTQIRSAVEEEFQEKDRRLCVFGDGFVGRKVEVEVHCHVEERETEKAEDEEGNPDSQGLIVLVIWLVERYVLTN